MLDAIPPKRTAGMSIVSLLIEIGLSAFLIVVLLQIFTVSRANYVLIKNIAEMDEAMYFMINTFTNIVPNAGYRTPTANGEFKSLTEFGKKSAAGEIIMAAGAFIQPLTSTNDGFTIAYQGHTDEHLKDCNSRKVGHDETIYLTFSQDVTTLRCYNVLEPDKIKNSLEIGGGVLKQFWVRYGIYEKDGGAKRIKYLPASEVLADPTQIKSVQIALLLRSKDEVYPKPRPFIASKWGEAVTIGGEGINDRYFYKFVMLTFPLIYGDL